jgi:beta-galactosidase
MLALLVTMAALQLRAQQPRTITDFDAGWKFYLGDNAEAKEPGFNDASWRSLRLPHDWSVELPFDSTSPTGNSGGALRGGTGWYRKAFTTPASASGKKVFIDFDGVYWNSEVWINGHYLGKRPSGYISFRYELTPFLKPASEKNVIAVKVDNSEQPNSRWYSGSGIYRNVWLVTTNPVFVDHWGTCITTPEVSSSSAAVVINATVNNSKDKPVTVLLKTIIYDAASRVVASATATVKAENNATAAAVQQLKVTAPKRWSLANPYLYKAVTQVIEQGKLTDEYTTRFGIRSIHFDVDKGFFLNGERVKIRGVCDHHDLGCLGTAINKRALERQLELLKGMGCNAIRTSHNPPAPELLELCDQMGFVVMDEAFDMWKRPKTKYDYHLYWDEWHARDLRDQIMRDRNHPSVFIWSVGNEIPEQWGGKNNSDTSGKTIVRELVSIVKSLDPTRPTVTANNDVGRGNQLLQSGALDLVGLNYHQKEWQQDSVIVRWGRKPLIITESTSALETRGQYDMPSDSVRRWPYHWDKEFKNGNPDLTCSAYDNVSAPWGSTHEETMKVFEKHDYISGMFIWTGFDYIGEPTPYPWPARSSYFGIIDLAGFPKDVYYMYQSVWTDKTVLHILPHWNWTPGDSIDVWIYYSHADEVELFLNGKSLGTRKKTGDDLHVMWRVKYAPGTLKAVSKKEGRVILTKEMKTAGEPEAISMAADRKTIKANGEDLSFITVKILDARGNLVPGADNEVQFTVSGEGSIVGVDNGSETSMELFKADHRKAFNGMCMLVVQSKNKAGKITVKATSKGLPLASEVIQVK